MNKGYIIEIKQNKQIRILAINLNGINLVNIEKNRIPLREFPKNKDIHRAILINRYQIDIKNNRYYDCEI